MSGLQRRETIAVLPSKQREPDWIRKQIKVRNAQSSSFPIFLPGINRLRIPAFHPIVHRPSSPPPPKNKNDRNYYYYYYLYNFFLRCFGINRKKNRPSGHGAIIS